MITVGNALHVKGEVRASEDITVEGQLEGSVFCEDGSVVVAPSASVQGDIFARDITVFGRATGRLIATDVVDIAPQATVSGQVISKRIILDDGARFDGRVEPQHLEAALRVARFERRQREAVLKAG
jgi:cytoskeletal protein CcmA (bactofilin family)